MSDDTPKVVPLPGARKRKVKNKPAIREEGNVSILQPPVSYVDIPPERVLQQAADHGLTDVLVIGWDLEGELYTHTTTASGPEVNWLLDIAKQKLFS